MNIVYHAKSKTFHLYNDSLSYIMTVLRNGHLGQLYCGARIHDHEDFSYFLELAPRAMSACPYENDRSFSLEHIRQELPSFGTGIIATALWSFCRQTAAVSWIFVM